MQNQPRLTLSTPPTSAPRVSRYSNVELLLWPDAEIGLVLRSGTGEVLRGYTRSAEQGAKPSLRAQ